MDIVNKWSEADKIPQTSGEAVVLKIDECLLKDGGARYKRELKVALSEINTTSEAVEGRSYLGASLVSKSCLRAIWYQYRKCVYTNATVDPKLIRLFARGHLEEARFTALLRQADFKVRVADEKGRQLSFAYGGKYAGSCDGVAVDDEGVMYLCEFKTHNDNSFSQLKQSGVRGSKPEHWRQVQIYLTEIDYNRALYLAVNKNDDELYCEIIVRDETEGLRLRELALRLIYECRTPPPRLEKISGYACTYCDFKHICEGLNTVIEKNCKTCVYWEALGSQLEPKEGDHCVFYDRRIENIFKSGKYCKDYKQIKV